jgi:hypothetical protein
MKTNTKQKIEKKIEVASSNKIMSRVETSLCFSRIIFVVVRHCRRLN